MLVFFATVHTQLHMTVMIGSLRRYWLARLLSFKRPLLSLVSRGVCLSVCLYVGNFDDISETKRFGVSNSDPIGNCLYGASIVESLMTLRNYDVMLVTLQSSTSSHSETIGPGSTIRVDPYQKFN